MLNGFKIGTRIKLGFSLLLLTLLLLLGSSIYSGWQIKENLEELQVNISAANNGNAMRLQMLQMRRFEKDMSLNLGKPEKVLQYLGKWQDAEKGMQQVLNNERKLADADEIVLFRQIEALNRQYTDGFHRVGSDAVAGKFSSPAEVNQAMEPFKKPVHELEQLIASYFSLQLQHQQLARDEITATVARSNSIAYTVGALAIGLALLVSWLITRSIQAPLTLLENSIQKSTRERDLRTRVEYAGKDEIGTTVAAINEFFTGVRELIESAKNGCNQLNQTAGSLTTVASEQNRAIGHQADTTSSTAASIEQLTVSISHVADTASAVEHDARQSQQLAADGRTLAEQTAGEINHIADSLSQSSAVIASLERRSAEIGGIVHVIKDIADQTNLLALNAAIEAARAGEQGRGFAVVADEVRKLAEKTTQATNEITTMILAVQQDTNVAVASMGDATNTVNRGVALTRQVADSLESITQTAIHSADRISGIAAAIGQQGAASTQIAQNIEKIAQMGEENSAATAQLADLAQNLNQLSATLGSTIKSYRS
ncbi:MAG: methyl-accepting chemotaxis protein [Chitinivorax sp.]